MIRIKLILRANPMANLNERFLAVIDSEAKILILDSIAKHYGITSAEAFAEVIDTEAEHLLDYMVEPQRSAASVLMQRHGMEYEREKKPMTRKVLLNLQGMTFTEQQARDYYGSRFDSAQLAWVSVDENGQVVED